MIELGAYDALVELGRLAGRLPAVAEASLRAAMGMDGFHAQAAEWRRQTRRQSKGWRRHLRRRKAAER
jgi:hypothetical protein